MSYDLSRLGPMYGKAGLQPTGELVSTRLTAATKAASTLDPAALEPAVRAAYGLKVDADELAPFFQIFRDSDPTFQIDLKSAEARILTSAVVSAVVESGEADSEILALLAVAGGLAGLRSPPEDPDFFARMLSELQRVQRTSNADLGHVAKSNSYALPKTTAEALKQKTEGSDWAGVSGELSGALQGLATHTTAADEKLRAGLNGAITRMNALSEQMEMQWLVSNGYSLDAQKPFAKILPLGHQVVVAARELAELTRRAEGVAAAPALLDQILERSKQSAKKLTLAKLATSSPREWRATWTGHLPDLPSSQLLPVTYAMKLATESEDQSDWEGRYQRETGIAPSHEMDALEWACQLYTELVAAKALG